MSEERSSEQRCGGHDALAQELREYATGALNLLEPWINQVRENPPAGTVELNTGVWVMVSACLAVPPHTSNALSISV